MTKLSLEQDPVAMAAELDKTWQGKCAAFFITHAPEMPEGYKVIDFRVPTGQDTWLANTGTLYLPSEDTYGYPSTPRPILESIVPRTEWVVPTDEDALKRPKCRVRDCESHNWMSATLYAVVKENPGCGSFYVSMPGRAVQGWKYCEIKKEVQP